MIGALKKSTPDVIKRFAGMESDDTANPEFKIDKVEGFLEEGQASPPRK